MSRAIPVTMERALSGAVEPPKKTTIHKEQADGSIKTTQVKTIQVSPGTYVHTQWENKDGKVTRRDFA